MQETFEQIIRYVRDIWRYRWVVIAAAWLVVIAGWAALSYKPIVYTASAKIYVDTYTVLQPLLKGIAIEKDPGAYLGLMTRLLVSRPNLEQVAQIVGRNREAMTVNEWETFLNGMERNIQVEGSRATEGARQSDFYKISYPNKDPQFAIQVVQALISTFADKTLKESFRDYAAAQQFLSQQISKQREELIAVDSKISQFKREHIDDLPKEGVNFFQRLQDAQTAVDEVQLKIKEAQKRRDDLRRQLAEIPATQKAISTDGKPVLSPIGTRLQELKSRLDGLLLQYTDQHPDVIAARRSIAELEKQLSSESIPVMPNPVYQQLKVALGQAESEIAALQARTDEYQNRVQELQERTEGLTEVEAELQRLNQDYDSAKQKYEALLARQDSATMAENVEQAGDDARFRVVDPPRILENANDVIRSRLLLTSGVLGAGFAGGVGVAVFLALLWPVVYDKRSLSELTSLPVVGTISQVSTWTMLVKRYFGLAGFLLTSLILFAGHGLAVFMDINSIKSTLQALGSSG